MERALLRCTRRFTRTAPPVGRKRAASRLTSAKPSTSSLSKTTRRFGSTSGSATRRACGGSVRTNVGWGVTYQAWLSSPSSSVSERMTRSLDAPALQDVSSGNSGEGRSACAWEEESPSRGVPRAASWWACSPARHVLPTLRRRQSARSRSHGGSSSSTTGLVLDGRDSTRATTGRAARRKTQRRRLDTRCRPRRRAHTKRSGPEQDVARQARKRGRRAWDCVFCAVGGFRDARFEYRQKIMVGRGERNESSCH